MGIYYCFACQQMKDDDWNPMDDRGICDTCSFFLEGWHITLNPKPIPDRSNDWDYVHEDYDGENGLCGTAPSAEKAIQAIIELETEQ